MQHIELVSNHKNKLPPGTLVKVVSNTNESSASTKSIKGEIGLVTNLIPNFHGSINFLEVLVNEKLYKIHCLDLQILEEENT